MLRKAWMGKWNPLYESGQPWREREQTDPGLHQFIFLIWSMSNVRIWQGYLRTVRVFFILNSVLFLYVRYVPKKRFLKGKHRLMESPLKQKDVYQKLCVECCFFLAKIHTLYLEIDIYIYPPPKKKSPSGRNLLSPSENRHTMELYRAI